MSPDELVEKVAAMVVGPGAPLGSRQQALDILRAVRDALREPDWRMTEQGHGELPCNPAEWANQPAACVWRAMLAASPLGRIDDA